MRGPLRMTRCRAPLGRTRREPRVGTLPKHLVTAVALAVALDLICAQPVDAYLDPGTGSYVFQLLIAGLVGVLFLVKVYWRRITAVCGRLFHKSGDDASARDERSTSDEEQCE